MVFGKLTGALKKGLSKTKDRIIGGLKTVLPLGRELDDDLIEETEEYLLTADIGPRTVMKIMDSIREGYRERQLRTTDDCYLRLKDILRAILREEGTEARLRKVESGPTVILVAGVNGAGKTTSIAKLTKRLVDTGNSVVLAAGDTFRAAAVEQLVTWGERIGVRVISQATGADPAAVEFDALEAAISREVDYLVVDTAGRLHTQRNLMNELEKMKRVISKRIPGAPHETLLVLDATTGQNAINQAVEFGKILDISGLFLTKLDGTAKGGAIIGIRDQVKIPIKFIGVGEKPEDVLEFDAEAFVKGLFNEPSEDESED